MAAFGNNKRAVENILVLSGNQDLINNVGAGGVLPGGGTRVGATGDIPLSSTVSTGHINLANGQLGIFAAGGASVRGNNIALLNTDTYLTAPAITIAVGTKNAQNPGRGNYPLVDNRPYESSGVLYGHNPVIMTGKGASYHAHSTWAIGQVTAITPFDNAEFAIHVGFRGYVMDVENSQHAVQATTYRFETPDYPAIGLVDDLDHFVQNFVEQINKNSRVFRTYLNNYGGNDPIVAYAIGLIANGAQDITAVGFDNGGVVNVQVRNNIQQTKTLSAEEVASLRLAIPALYGIVNVNTATAGTAINAEWMLLQAVDRDLAYDDRVPQVKIRLDVGLLRGFDSTVSTTELVNAYEGEGVARIWEIIYTNSAGQRKYSQFQRQSWPFIEIPSGLDLDIYYNAVIIEHRSNKQISSAEMSVSPKKTIILFPACSDTTRVALLDYLNRWVKSVPSHFIIGNLSATGDLVMNKPTLCP